MKLLHQKITIVFFLFHIFFNDDLNQRYLKINVLNYWKIKRREIFQVVCNYKPLNKYCQKYFTNVSLESEIRSSVIFKRKEMCKYNQIYILRNSFYYQFKTYIFYI